VLQDFLAGAAQLGLDATGLERALGSDAHAWAHEFGVARDVSGLVAEKNVLRYRPVPVTVRAEDGDATSLLRVVGAGVLARSHVAVSTPEPLPSAVSRLLHTHGVACRVEDADAWQTTLRGDAPARVRLIGGSSEAFAEASGGRADIALYAQPVVEAGRIELLTFLREQAISITAHRFGSPTALVEGLLA
jgi:RHH-type transcriptional regulator, proline utilization regulon repressor / proline dehydrogenase / delta 1-pyrroline-5-carboxylate dehydrogenase